MSEAAKEEAPKKKKGKLPMIIALVAILGGGGFFVMKGKGKKHEKPVIKLGVIEPIPEFLVNLAGGQTFLRTEVALQFAEGFKKEELDKNMPAIRDAILSELTTRSQSELKSLAGKRKLKIRIAEAVNALFPGEDAHGEATPSEDAKDSKDTKKKDEKKEDKPKDENPEWDSQTGPCLKVYFTSFAMQY